MCSGTLAAATRRMFLSPSPAVALDVGRRPTSAAAIAKQTDRQERALRSLACSLACWPSQQRISERAASGGGGGDLAYDALDGFVQGFLFVENEHVAGSGGGSDGKRGGSGQQSRAILSATCDESLERNTNAKHFRATAATATNGNKLLL